MKASGDTMKAQPLKLCPDVIGYQPCEPAEATHLMLNMPGPIPVRILPVMIGGTRAGTPNWTFRTAKGNLRGNLTVFCAA